MGNGKRLGGPEERLFQPSLRDWIDWSHLPRTASWASVSRPFGTLMESFRGLFSRSFGLDQVFIMYLGLRPGLVSAIAVQISDSVEMVALI
jgi:hypothetical protein